MEEIENAYIFVSDALRWDYLPDSVRKLGAVKKTAAASTLSPTSFASLTSGLYPPVHDVQTFTDRIPQGRNLLLEAESYTTSFYQSSNDDPIYDVLNQSAKSSQKIDQMEPPFINIERNLLTHAPYSYTQSEVNYTAGEYLDRETKNLNKLREQYRIGAERAASVFQDRLNALEELGVLKNTLVIFTSDHGELLGEYAGLSHVSPVVPEMVYVPTVIITPDDVDVSCDEIISHIDITATVADVLNIKENYNIDGINIFSDNKRKYGYSGFEFPPNHGAFGESDSILHRYGTSVHSLWDNNGGIVLNNSTFRSRIQEAAKHFRPTSVSKRNVILQNPKGLISLIRLLTQKTSQFGNPSFDRTEAQSVIDTLLNESTLSSNQESINKEQEDRLRDLGYI